MTHYDLTPLLRSTIGFDRLARMMDSAFSNMERQGTSYPPYDIVKTGENDYQITLAVAGFSMDEIDITVQENSLIVSGQKAESEDKAANEHNYLHQGIAARAFERRFQLADTIEVKHAQLDNGLLHISLFRNIPERMKPRKIEISAQPLLNTSGVEQKRLKNAN